MSVEPRQVLVAGGGVGGLEAVLALRELAGERVSITLLAPDRHFSYRPLAVGEPFGVAAACRYELAAVARETGVGLVRDAIDAVDAELRTARTHGGALLAYDDLVLALGARPREAVAGAVTFRGPRDVERVALALRGVRPGGHVAFVVPAGRTWPLPIYELALLAGVWVQRERPDVELSLLTAEDAPLGIFGAAASAEVCALLEERGVALRTQTVVENVEGGRLWMGVEGSVAVDEVVSLPRLAGPAIRGVPRDDEGFVPVDAQGKVADGVYAVGDMTSRSVKQGGLAAQQADAVASRIARAAGAPVDPEPYAPVLRALLLTGDQPRWLRHGGDPGVPEVESGGDAAWWPPHKIAGRRLAPWLAAHQGLAEPIHGDSPRPISLVSA